MTLFSQNIQVISRKLINASRKKVVLHITLIFLMKYDNVKTVFQDILHVSLEFSTTYTMNQRGGSSTHTDTKKH